MPDWKIIGAGAAAAAGVAGVALMMCGGKAKMAVKLYATENSFCALAADGSIMAWPTGPECVEEIEKGGGFQSIEAGKHFFVGMLKNNTVVIWGHSRTQKYPDAIIPDIESFKISSHTAVLMGKGSKGTVAYSPETQKKMELPGKVAAVSSTEFADAVILEDGSVFAWGDKENGGDIPVSTQANLRGKKVVSITGNKQAFAALTEEGRVFTWGDVKYGGDSSKVAGSLTDVTTVVAANQAFAALKNDGRVVVWGDVEGDDISAELKDIRTVVASRSAFAAVKNDGSVLAWGKPQIGGRNDEAKAACKGGVKVIVPSDFAFAAIRKDGTVGVWGDKGYGGSLSSEIPDVSMIIPGGRAFAALKSNGSVVAWGSSKLGGNTDSVKDSLSGGVVSVVGNNGSFAALRSNGEIVTWGDEFAKRSRGSTSSAVRVGPYFRQ